MDNHFSDWGSLTSKIRSEIVTHLDRHTIQNLRSTSKAERGLIDSMGLASTKVSVYFNGNYTSVSYRTTAGKRIHLWGNLEPLSPKVIMEELAKMPFVDTLSIDHDFPAEQFIPQNLRVKNLMISESSNDNNHKNAILQLDPNFLESVTYFLRGELNDSELCSIPQIVNVSRLDIDRNTITKDQLLNFKATHLKIGPQTLISPADLNAFFKKTLEELDSKDINFKITYPKGLKHYAEIIEGMRVESNELILNSYETNRFVDVHSPHDDYLLSITFSDLYLTARRIPAIRNVPHSPPRRSVSFAMALMRGLDAMPERMSPRARNLRYNPLQ